MRQNGKQLVEGLDRTWCHASESVGAFHFFCINGINSVDVDILMA